MMWKKDMNNIQKLSTERNEKFIIFKMDII